MMDSCVDCILSAERLDGLAAVSDEFLRLGCAGRLCYYTHDWFRPGGTDMDPAIGPGEPQPVLHVRFGVGEGFLERFIHRVEGRVRPGELVLDDNVARVCGNDFRERPLFALLEKQLQDERRTHRRVPAEVEFGENDAAVSFSTNRRLFGPHPRSYVDLADR